MVKVIIEQKKGYKNIINFIKSSFSDKSDKGDWFTITTMEYVGHMEHSYFVRGDWTIKIKDDKLFIISERIVSVIDLKEEAPYEITHKVI